MFIILCLQRPLNNSLGRKFTQLLICPVVFNSLKKKKREFKLYNCFAVLCPFFKKKQINHFEGIY